MKFKFLEKLSWKTVLPARQLSWCLLLSAFIVGDTDGAEISIEQVTFHQVYQITSGGPQQEGGEADSGGAVFIFIRNNGATQACLPANAITNVLVNGMSLASTPGFKWARAWPECFGPGESTVVTVKGVSSPLAEGQVVTLGVKPITGTMVQTQVFLSTPLLRVGHALPSRDRRTLFVFLRNTDSQPYEINQVFVDEEVTARCTFVGGRQVGPGEVKIVKIEYADSAQLADLRPLLLRVNARRGTENIWTGGFVRITEPMFALGTWSGDVFNSDAQMVEARKSFGHNFAGPVFDWTYTPDRAASYAMRSLTLYDNVPNPNPQQAVEKAHYPGIYGWYMDDEPELKNVSSVQEFNATLTVWQNDPRHPTMLNLARSRQFQQYLLAVDHLCMDHYAQYAPLVYGGFLTSYSIKEAFWYSDSLKRNTEPLRIGAMCRGCPPPPVGGARRHPGESRCSSGNTSWAAPRALKWFFAEKAGEKPASTTNTYNAMKQSLRELDQVRDLVLYSELTDVVVPNHPQVLSRALVGESHALVPVLNASGVSINLGLGYVVTMTNYTDVAVTIQLPSHVVPDQVQEVTPEGFRDVVHTRSGSTITISNLVLDTNFPHRLYLIGPVDTNAPSAPTELNLVAVGSGVVVSWKESHDNLGVKGYKVFRDGVQVADVRTPIYEDASAVASNVYYVVAYDSSGNSSPPSGATRQSHNGWFFNVAGDYEGWQELYETVNSEVRDGALTYQLRGTSQPRLLSPGMRIDTSVIKRVRVHYRNASAGQHFALYFSPDGNSFANRGISILPNDNQWRATTVDFSDHAEWTGIITELRMDFPSSHIIAGASVSEEMQKNAAYNDDGYLWAGAPRVVFAGVSGRFRAPNNPVARRINPANSLDVAEVAKNRSRCLQLTTLPT